MTWTSKLRTAGGGWVSNRIDVLKQSCLQSFKTRRFGSVCKALKLVG
ncbi:hypothetical protein HMPREF9554_01446 [Treponema phagedenis F0421]|nr:hypothetical protein HMPREF9554_01446 [Treponema phagedenis F0421]